MAKRRKSSFDNWELRSATLLALFLEVSRDERRFPEPPFFAEYEIGTEAFKTNLLYLLCGEISQKKLDKALRRAMDLHKRAILAVIHEGLQRGQPRWTTWDSHEVDQSAQRAIGVMALEASAA